MVAYLIKKSAAAGNRTRVARVAGEHHTTRPRLREIVYIGFRHVPTVETTPDSSVPSKAPDTCPLF